MASSHRKALSGGLIGVVYPVNFIEGHAARHRGIRDRNAAA
jgi:hypothetical protein